MDALIVGDPADPATDVGPVIDAAAKAALEAHAARLRARGQGDPAARRRRAGLYFPPILAEIPNAGLPRPARCSGRSCTCCATRPASWSASPGRWPPTRYGLTLGVHSRLESFADEVRALVPAGNCYVNRSIIGAVVGVQPFGGEGLSGTGPKAGGPHALTRFCVERAVSVNTAAQGGDPALFNL